MTLITLDEAEQDFVESVTYYESREPGLGSRFRDEVPTAGRIDSPTSRRPDVRIPLKH